MIELPDIEPRECVSRAAVAYVRGGIGIVPMNPRKPKSCGSLIGRPDDDTDKWYQHVSTDRALIDYWRRRYGSFNDLAIATSPGAWGGIVLDVDKPDEFPRAWRDLLDTVPFTATKPQEHSRRGHYWFMLPADVGLIGNPAHKWGDVRSYGGGLVLAPFPDDDRHIVRSGPLSVIPADLLALIAGSGCVGVELITTNEFCAKYQGASMVTKLNGLPGLHGKKLSYLNEHKTMLATMTQGFIEARLGFVPARAVIDTLRPLWGKRSASEFNRLVRDCANYVEALSPEEMKVEEAKTRRGKGSDSRQYAGKLPQSFTSK